MKTPVVFLIFNRPDTTEKVFSAIRQARPPQLLVVADGARMDREGEAEKCAATRAIIDRVDWDCEVLTNYSDLNLGCKKRVSSGLSWVFNLVEEAIILEDDCLPHPTFFRFCEELLDYYRDNEKIMSIAGQNVQFGRKRNEYSYYFSCYFHCWGWATWKRAWQQYDLNMKDWLQVKDSDFLLKILEDPLAVNYWQKIFKMAHEGKKSTWAYQWMYSCWLKDKLNVIPQVNLVSNLGFSADATNTQATRKDNIYADMKLNAMTFPLQHPPLVEANVQADRFTQETFFNPSLLNRAKAKINRTLGIRSI